MSKRNNPDTVIMTSSGSSQLESETICLKQILVLQSGGVELERHQCLPSRCERCDERQYPVALCGNVGLSGF